MQPCTGVLGHGVLGQDRLAVCRAQSVTRRAFTARLSKRLTQVSMELAEAIVGTKVVPAFRVALSRLVKPPSLIWPRRLEMVRPDVKLIGVLLME